LGPFDSTISKRKYHQHVGFGIGLGQTATRDVYQSTIEALEDAPATQLCLDFAKMETSLPEMDRARVMLTYGAQMVDPWRNDDYWRAWNEFEIAHGNEETFREMLQIKRSVEASFSTVNYNLAEMSATTSKVDTLSNKEAMQMIANREGVKLGLQDKAQPPVAGFVSAK
jgi:pre-mRNA-splicing factor SYF1